MDYKEIERSIIKKYRKTIWSKFVKAVNDYKLISENDKIMVCISGGKDSFLLAKLMEEIKRHGKINFEVVFVVMNPGYSEENINKIKEIANILNLKIEVFDTDIFEVANKLNPNHPCYMCARMRRGYLYNKASELGCNKIALGHHFDDVIETTLLNMFYASEIKTMMPKLYSDNYKGIELIRPMYLIKEMDILSWAKSNNLSFINCACSFTNKQLELGKRQEIKELIRELRKNNKDIDYNIFKSMSNINLDAILGYHSDKGNYNFLDDYNKKGEKNEK